MSIHNCNTLYVIDFKSVTHFLLLFILALASWSASAETITAGRNHTCMIQPDKSVVCWGDNEYQQSTPPPLQFTDIDAGHYHNCGITTDGTIACWGNDSVAQSTPPSGNGFIQVSSGDNHSCAVKNDGTLYCWGYNRSGQTKVPEGQYLQVSGGSDHTCAVKTDNTIVCWGAGGYGQKNAPQDQTFSYVGSGSLFSCGIKTDGSTTCWGHDGLGETSGAPFGISTKLSVGSYYGACRIKTDGVVNCWGSRGATQGEFSHIGVGYNHVCGIKTDGTPVCWGSNEFDKATPFADLKGDTSGGDGSENPDDGNGGNGSENPDDGNGGNGSENPDDGNGGTGSENPDKTTDEKCEGHAHYDAIEGILNLPAVDMATVIAIGGYGRGISKVTGTVEAELAIIPKTNLFEIKQVNTITPANPETLNTPPCHAEYLINSEYLIVPKVDIDVVTAINGVPVAVGSQTATCDFEMPQGTDLFKIKTCIPIE